MQNMENLDSVRQKLLEKKQQLESQLSNVADRDPSEDTFRLLNNEPEDDAQESEAGTKAVAERVLIEKTLSRVERALEKIDAGTYGICDMTGEQIDPNRLEVIPWAIYTLEAEERLESRGRV